MIWSRVSRSVGKKGVYYRGMAIWIVVLLGLFAVQPTWPSWAVIVLGVLAGIGVATAYLVPWAMLPDVIELDELETGQRREGVYYGFVRAAAKDWASPRPFCNWADPSARRVCCTGSWSS